MNDTEATTIVNVSELHALRIENAALKMQQFEALYNKTAAEQRAHIDEARKEVAAPADWAYDLTSRTFKPGAVS